MAYVSVLPFSLVAVLHRRINCSQALLFYPVSIDKRKKKKKKKEQEEEEKKGEYALLK